MFTRRMIVYALLLVGWFLGMDIGGAISGAFAKECYRSETCGYSCYYFPELGLFNECKGTYKKAVRDDECGLGLKHSTSCGTLYIGTVGCDTSTGTACGGDAYSNGAC